MATKRSTPTWSDVKARVDVRNTSRAFGYGVEDEMGDLLSRYGVDE